ncbi:MAG: hypothetical protein E7406_01530 [Ruminococcaceae bacterium]|nr:hypothetical protein [Oscillospiraceae bacterium]
MSYDENNNLILFVSRYRNVENEAYIEFRFNMGSVSKEKADEVKGILHLLRSSKEGGFSTLIKQVYAPDTPYNKSDLKDEYISGFSGLFESELSVKDGRIIYQIKLTNDFSKGRAYFDLDRASKNKIKLLKNSIEIFEKDYFNEFLLKLQQIKAE